MCDVLVFETSALPFGFIPLAGVDGSRTRNVRVRSEQLNAVWRGVKESNLLCVYVPLSCSL